jgi:molybdenum cofactor cytidylyltransferase
VATIPEPVQVHAVILAAGQSKRLGRPKQLLDICGQPMIRRVAEVVVDTSLESIMIVLGHASSAVERALAGLNIQIASNPDFGSGQSSSLRTGVRALPASADAVLFLLGDQPTISSSVIESVVETYRVSRPAIVQARYRGQPGHPVLFDRLLFGELSEVSGDQGAREVLRRYAADVTYVEIDQDAPLDIDTEADYQLAMLRRVLEDQAK